MMLTPVFPSCFLSFFFTFFLSFLFPGRPLIGVNYNCHNFQKCNVPLNESIARAVRQVQFAMQRGFRGAFWYVGNEDQAAKLENTLRIAHHVRAMKAVDPTLKAFWNDNDIQPNDLHAFLNATGDLMDGAEFHGKWPYGGTPKGFLLPTLNQFLNEVPLYVTACPPPGKEKKDPFPP